MSTRRRARRRRGKSHQLLLRCRRILLQLRSVLTEQLPAWYRQHRQHLKTGMLSLGVHGLVALLLAVWILPADTTDPLFLLWAEQVPEEEQSAEVELANIVQPELLPSEELDNTLQQVLDVMQDQPADLIALDTAPELAHESLPELLPEDIVIPAVQGDFGGRTTAGKKALLKKFGGTAESEQAVTAGLNWLKKIQLSDGSWSFGQPGPQASPGGYRSTDMGATSLALLCFLGAGYTHRSESPYRSTVDRGLHYMKQKADVRGELADLRGEFEGSAGMYVQGLATICLCEVHALEPADSELEDLAQRAIRFIEQAQHPRGGGWRYSPRQNGDTSVTGWQVMALQSARTGGIDVSPASLKGASHFLDSVAVRGGAGYIYTPARGLPPQKTMTAVGLLCRMYLGWRHDSSALSSGVAALSSTGPSADDIYFNYYATQVLHHWGGSRWTKWNKVMRDSLVNSQIRQGPAAGSWTPTDPHAWAGGQIYQTTLSLLTLEVYYRHLPIYRQLKI